MALDIEILGTAASIVDVAQVAEAGEVAPWLNALLGMGTVLTALILIWIVTAVVGSYFVKAKAAPGKPKAAASAPAAAAAAAPAAAANSIPLAVIIAAAAQMVDGPIRNVTVNAPGMSSPVWVGQGRSAIFSSHSAKAPSSVGSLGGIRKG